MSCESHRPRPGSRWQMSCESGTLVFSSSRFYITQGSGCRSLHRFVARLSCCECPHALISSRWSRDLYKAKPPSRLVAAPRPATDPHSCQSRSGRPTYILPGSPQLHINQNDRHCQQLIQCPPTRVAPAPDSPNPLAQTQVLFPFCPANSVLGAAHAFALSAHTCLPVLSTVA